MFKISYRPSTSHWLFPPIVIGILIILLAAITLRRYLRCRKSGEPFIKLNGYLFFVKGWDRMRFIGTFVLFVFYVFSMNLFGFLASSIVFIFLYNVLYVGVDRLFGLPAEARAGNAAPVVRSLAVSLAISVISSASIWYLFGQVFKITLP